MRRTGSLFLMIAVLVTAAVLLPAAAAAENPLAGMRTYTEGQYRVGTDMVSGEYVVLATGDYSGYFCVSSDANGKDILFNDLFEVNSILTVRSGEYVKLSRCIAVSASDFYSEYTIKYKGNYGVMLKVGYDIAPGTYRLRQQPGSEYSGYYCVYADSRHGRIVANDLFTGSAYVTVSSGQYLILNRCTIDN